MRKKKTETVQNIDIPIAAEKAVNEVHSEILPVAKPITEKPKAKRGRPRKKVESETVHVIEQTRDSEIIQPVPEIVNEATQQYVLPLDENKAAAETESAIASAEIKPVDIAAVETKTNEPSQTEKPEATAQTAKQQDFKKTEHPGKEKRHFHKNNNYKRNRYGKKKNYKGAKPQGQAKKLKIDNDPFGKSPGYAQKPGYEQGKPKAKNPPNQNHNAGKKKRHPHNPQYGGTLENQHTVIPGANNRYRKSYMNRVKRTGGQTGFNSDAPPRKKSTAGDSAQYGSSKPQDVYTHYDERSVFGGSTSGRRSIKSETKMRWNEKFGGKRKPKSDGRDKSR